MTPLSRLSAYGLPPPGMNFSRRRDVLAVGQVDLPQPAVPRHGIDGVLPGRRLRHRRHRRLPARAQRVVACRPGWRACCRSAGARSAGRSRRRCRTDRRRRRRRRAISRVPCGVVTRSAISGANRLCIARGVLSSFSFHSSFVLPTLAGVNTFSSRTQPVRALSTPSVRKSDAQAVIPDNSESAIPTLATRIAFLPRRLFCPAPCVAARCAAAEAYT